MRFFVLVFAIVVAIFAGAVAYGFKMSEFWQGVVFGGVFVGIMWAMDDV